MKTILTRKYNQRGDTIIEVVIAITIISMLLTGALVLTRTNLLNVRSAQEHGEALQLAQSQLEDIRAYITAEDLPNSTFCIDNAAGNAIETDLGNCSVNTAQPIYSIADSPPTGTSNTFKVNVSWPDVSGVGQDNVALYYNFYPQ